MIILNYRGGCTKKSQKQGTMKETVDILCCVKKNGYTACMSNTID